jgi:hypothetical protein
MGSYRMRHVSVNYSMVSDPPLALGGAPLMIYMKDKCVRYPGEIPRRFGTAKRYSRVTRSIRKTNHLHEGKFID